MTHEHEESDEVIKARQRKRAIALAIVLGALVVLFYAITIARMGGHVFDKAPM